MIPEALTRLYIPAGRIILAVYFLLPGLMKFTQYDMHVDYMASHGMFWIPFFLILSGLIQVGGAAALFAGYQVQIVAFVLAGLTFIISLVMHDFWTMAEGLQRSHETQNFFKNMGITAGLLVLSSAGAGAFSVDNRQRKA
ncbi:MAG: DoxX family protein [Pseudohongiella sp.]